MTLKSREEINIVTKKKKIGLGKILIPFFYENEINQPVDVRALGWIEMFCFFSKSSFPRYVTVSGRKTTR